MAIQTRTFTSMSSLGSLLFECILHYDDADYREINDDGDPDDFLIDKFVVTNYHTKPLVVTAQRGNGQNWVSRTIPSGQTQEQSGGGAVKYEGDLPQWYWEWGAV